MTAYHKICPLPVNENTAAAGSTGGQGPCRVGARMEWLAVRDGTGGCGCTTTSAVDRVKAHCLRRGGVYAAVATALVLLRRWCVRLHRDWCVLWRRCLSWG